MRRFLVKTGITIVVLLLASFIIDISVSRSLRHSSAQLFSPWNDLYADTLNYDMVFLGSSRTYMHYNPEIFDSVLGTHSFNCGLAARGLDAQTAKYHAFCRSHGMPDYLILNFDVCSFHPSNQTEQEKQYIVAHTDREQYFPYFFDRDLVKELCSCGGEDISWSERYLPLVRYAGYKNVLREAFGGKALPQAPSVRGFAGFDYKTDWDFRTWGHFLYKKDSRFDSLLEQLMTECREDHVTPVFVLGPVFDQYMLQLDNRDEALAEVHNMAEQYNVPLFDYTESYISSDSTFFCDPIHLNSCGANRFSMMLAQSLQDSLGIGRSIVAL